MTALASTFLDRPIAHRGWHDRMRGRPENSRAAFQGALEHGYGIELDVQLSADGEAMVFHDETLDRLTDETGPVRERTAADLGRIALRNGASGQGIPRLSEIVDLIGGRTPLLIEIKDQSGALGPTDGRLEEAVARALSDVSDLRPYAVMSFNPESVRLIADLLPGLARGLTTERFSVSDWGGVPNETLERLDGIPDYDAVGASFVSHHHRDLAAPRIAELKSRGAAILCWTIRSRAEEAEARRIAHNVTFEGYEPEPRGA